MSSELPSPEEDEELDTRAVVVEKEGEELDERAVVVEKSEFIQADARRRRVVPRAALLGAFVGGVAVAFRLALDRADFWRNHFFAAWGHLGLSGLAYCILWSALFACAGTVVVKIFAPEAGGSGIPHLKGVLLGMYSLRSGRILVVKFVGGLLALGSGLIMGREGPTLQMGGALGGLAARFLRSDGRERQILLAAGAAAGLSAAFNAPLAGLLFVLEEVQRDFDPPMFAAALVASLVADIMGRSILGSAPAFEVNVAPASLLALSAYAVLGVLCGGLGVAFNRALMTGSNPSARWQKLPLGVWPLLVGSVIGAIGFWKPEFLSAGHGATEALLSQSSRTNLAQMSLQLLWMLPLLFALRFVLTASSYSTGAAGGFFAPILAMGAQIGLFVVLFTHWLLPTAILHPQNFAVVGMAALFAASVRAPLTAIVLIIEMTNGYSLVLPLATACLCAYGTADALRNLPIYEALLERDLEGHASHVSA